MIKTIKLKELNWGPKEKQNILKTLQRSNEALKMEKSANDNIELYYFYVIFTRFEWRAGFWRKALQVNPFDCVILQNQNDSSRKMGRQVGLKFSKQVIGHLLSVGTQIAKTCPFMSKKSLSPYKIKFKITVLLLVIFNFAPCFKS
jgi:hypothetical protein